MSDEVAFREQVGVAEIRADLVTLRQRLGIAYERMPEASAICSLPVVSLELAALRRPEADRPYVAYDLLACAARRADLVGRDYSTVLVITLNFDHVHEELGLRRQRAAESLPYIGIASEMSETYVNLERRAYEALAGVMAGRVTSPCAPEAADVALASKTEGQIAALQARLETYDTFFEELERSFTRLRKAKTQFTQYDACDALLDLSPRARAFATEAWALSDSRNVVSELIQALALRFYDHWYRSSVFTSEELRYLNNARPGVHDRPPSGFSADEVALYWRLFESDAAPEGETLVETLRVIDAEREGTYGYQRLDDGIDFGPWEGQGYLNASFLIIERIWWSLEVANDWESLDPGAAARARRAHPLSPTRV